VKPAGHRIMVNARKVNGRIPYFLPANFCDSGRILDSRNPVKYNGNLQINPNLQPKLAAAGARDVRFPS
jgi:hypothetical protein